MAKNSLSRYTTPPRYTTDKGFVEPMEGFETGGRMEWMKKPSIHEG